VTPAAKLTTRVYAKFVASCALVLRSGWQCDFDVKTTVDLAPL